MKLLVILIISAISLTSITPGLRIQKLVCKSLSGNTYFEADIAEFSSLQSAKFSIDEKELNFTYKDEYHIIFDEKSKVFTIGIESETSKSEKEYKFLDFWAVPSTFKDSINDPKHSLAIYSFSAKIRAKDPRPDKEFETPEMLLNCTLTCTER